MRRVDNKNYLITVLTAILVCNYLDRVVLGVVLQDLKIDLGLSDTQLGFLSGMAFALFYSLMGVPIARWADRGNRVAIISVTAVLWSIAVILCGFAESFVQLMLIRVVVAVGEAGCTPPAFSLMADYFSRAERPRAAALYGLGGPLSALLGFFLAGWLAEFYGWRMTFMLLGPPGLLLAVLAWFTLREPRHRSRDTVAPRALEPPSEPSVREVCITLWANITFRHLLLCLAVMFFFNYGILQWLPTFFIRSYSLSTGAVGTWLAVIVGLGGMLGSYLGGELATRYAPQNERVQLGVMAFAIAGSGILSSIAYIAPTQYVAFGLMAAFFIGLTSVNGPLFATIQTLVPERMRAVAFALVYLFANLIGMGLGPLAAGALSDALRPWAGEESLRYALLLLGPGYFWGAWHAWRASKTVAHDLAAA
jgi:MFS transporter, Spinster family, sphingosine-1-phosphate transporter